MTTLATALLLALAASGDRETSKGSCTDYVAHYREMLRDRAVLESAPAQESSHSPNGRPAAEAATAEADAERVFDAARPRVEQSCRKVNRSEWECVVGAGSYGDLAACQIRGLPLLPDDRRVADERKQLEDAAALRASRDPVRVTREYVATGNIEVSPDLTRAAFEEVSSDTSPPSAPSSR